MVVHLKPQNTKKQALVVESSVLNSQVEYSSDNSLTYEDFTQFDGKVYSFFCCFLSPRALAPSITDVVTRL